MPELSMPLFDTQSVAVAEMPREESRQSQIDAAFDHADTAFKEEYTAFALLYAASHKDFTGEDVSEAYRRNRTLPQPREWRAIGGIYQRLIRQRLIEPTREYRLRANKTPTAVYRLVK